MGAETLPDTRVKEAVTDFEAVRIDFDTAKELSEKYGVKAMPDLRILKSDGTEVYRVKSGKLSPDELVRELTTGLAKAK